MDASGTKPLTSSAYFILVALADRPRHGLGIADEIERRTGGEMSLGPGTLYHALKKVLASGHIEETDQRPDPDDDPRRRYYRITRTGREAVRRETRRLHRVLQIARGKGLLPEQEGA